MTTHIPGSTTLQPGRYRVIKQGSNPTQMMNGSGPVVYWMFRDQRVRDNWALIHAVDQANKMNVPIAVAFNLFDMFKGAKARHLGFMLRGLKQLQSSLQTTLQIPFFLFKGAEVPEVDWCEPGETAAMEVLNGDMNGFLTKRLKNYATDRNNPLKPKALSGLSPYLHFGQISAQRCAFEARKAQKLYPQAADAFLEELIVRRELADNYCYYQPQYDSLMGAWEWARKSLMDHANDKREHLYTREQFEKGKTADPLWNAAQLEMVHYGKMHGFMRMYWAKKILEWTSGPEEALSTAICLNDKYELDGRDPSGYVGCMWSICGVHDQGWQERPIFGKVRYMNYAGCKRKFNVDGYISYVKRLVGETKKRKAETLLSSTKDKKFVTDSDAEASLQ